MNLIDKAFIRLVLLPQGAYRRMGVNLPQLYTLLKVKLTMDNRRPNTMQLTKREKSDKPVTAATIGTIIVSSLMGLAYLFAFGIGNNIVLQLLLYFSLFFFMLSASLISNFTSVLIDVRDNYIVLPKPVNDRTVVTARILHICIHMGKMVLPMLLPGLTFIVYNYGAPAGVYFLLMALLLTLFSIFFINAAYIVILKFTTPEKFKNVISYVQIFFAIAIYASYQIVPRMMRSTEDWNYDPSSKASSLLLPPYWFAGGWQVLYRLKGNPVELVSLAMSFLIPLCSIYLVIKYLAPSFNRKVSMMSHTAAESRPQTTAAKAQKGNKNILANLLTQAGAERMGYLFTWKMTARSRDFRLKVYPTIGYMLVYVVIIFFNGKKMNLEKIRSHDMAGKVLIISALYFSSMILIMAVTQMKFSEKYKAAWMYAIAPVQKPGVIINGALKAMMVKFYFPLFALIAAAGTLLMGWPVVPNLILGLLNQVLLVYLMVYAGNQYLPFSTYENEDVKRGGFLKSVFIMICFGIIGSLHFLVYNILPVVIIFIFLSGIAVWLLMGSIKEASSQKVRTLHTKDF